MERTGSLETLESTSYYVLSYAFEEQPGILNNSLQFPGTLRRIVLTYLTINNCAISEFPDTLNLEEKLQSALNAAAGCDNNQPLPCCEKFTNYKKRRERENLEDSARFVKRRPWKTPNISGRFYTLTSGRVPRGIILSTCLC